MEKLTAVAICSEMSLGRRFNIFSRALGNAVRLVLAADTAYAEVSFTVFGHNVLYCNYWP